MVHMAKGEGLVAQECVSTFETSNTTKCCKQMLSSCGTVCASTSDVLSANERQLKHSRVAPPIKLERLAHAQLAAESDALVESERDKSQTNSDPVGVLEAVEQEKDKVLPALASSVTNRQVAAHTCSTLLI